MERVTVLIVDDELPARRKVRRLLAADPDVDVLGEAGTGTEAVERIRALDPDIAILDIQMPGLDGFGVLATLAEDERPVVIFATAYDEFAIRAFDVSAVDYLLKPFDSARLARALERAKARVREAAGGETDRRIRELLERVGAAPGRIDRLLVRSGDRSYFVPVDDIDWIEASQNYLRLNAAGETHIVRGTMAGLSERLDPARFVRIHRSHIVNVERIRELRTASHGDYTVVLFDGTRLALSRRYRDRLPALFDQRF